MHGRTTRADIPAGLVKMAASITYKRVRSSGTSLAADRKIKPILNQQQIWRDVALLREQGVNLGLFIVQ